MKKTISCCCVAASLVAGSVLAADTNWPPNAAARTGMPVRVACVGDSLTTGFLMAQPARDSYPAQLGRMLGAGWEVRSFANPGRTALKKYELTLWKEAAFQQAQDWQPEAVILCLGSNDADPAIWDRWKEEFAADYRAMVEVFAKLPSKPRIWLCLPPPMFLAPGDPRMKNLSDGTNPIIRKIAAAAGCGVIDWYGEFDGKRPLFMEDGVHPLPAGAEVMARTAFHRLRGDAATRD